MGLGMVDSVARGEPRDNRGKLTFSFSASPQPSLGLRLNGWNPTNCAGAERLLSAGRDQLDALDGCGRAAGDAGDVQPAALGLDDRRAAMGWSPVMLWAGGATLEVSGLENLSKGQPYIFVSNAHLPGVSEAARARGVRSAPGAGKHGPLLQLDVLWQAHEIPPRSQSAG